MSDPLDLLLHDGIIEAVISRLKSGKEADIYLVQHAGEILAAKIYKERDDRSFKNNAVYLEGRSVRNSRTARAMQKGSRFGRAAAELDWKSRESDALHKLHAAGVRVPQPNMFYEGVLLMEVVVDPAGHPAPRLIEAHLEPAQAAELYADLRQQIITMLTCDVIHGDLSPYNVLMAWNGPTIIDFPQLVDAAHNRQSQFFFERDLNAIRNFFAQLDPALHAHGDDARQIWRAWERRELSTDFVPVPRPEQRDGQRRGGGKPKRQGPPQGPRQEQRAPPQQQRGPQQQRAAQEQRGPQQQPRAPQEHRGSPQPRGPQEQRGPQQPRGNPQGPRNGSRPPRRDDRAPSGPQVSYVGQVVPLQPQASTPKAQPVQQANAPGGQGKSRRRRRGRGGRGGAGGSSGTGQQG